MTAAEAAAHDRYAHQAYDIPARLLMENAARALALVVHRLYPTGPVVGLIGKGHNGGDALVALRGLQAWGREVAAIGTGGEHEVLLHGANIPTVDSAALSKAGIIIDGLLGTGSAGAPRADVARLIEAAHAAAVPIVAVDLPSGVDATSGEVAEPAIAAEVTVTFGYPKIGLLRHPARERCGRLICVEIGFPELPRDHVSAQLITPAMAAALLPRRKPTAHKGDSGRLLMLVGSPGMAGAAVISGEAAVHAGAGLVRLVSHAGNRELLQRAVAEATFFPLDGTMDVDGVTAVVAGCGLGLSDEARAALERVLEQTSGVPTLLDADALNILAEQPDALRRLAHERPLLVTPHPKELSRLSHAATSDIVADPHNAARAFADATGAVVLLKGQPSVVATPHAPLLINSVGSSDFAVAGMGDQLAGVIGAMLAAGLEPRAAAATGLFFAGRAGEIAARGRALTPRDVTAHLGAAFNDAGPATSNLAYPFITFDQPARW